VLAILSQSHGCCCTQHSWPSILQRKIRPNRQQTALTACSPCWLVLATLSQSHGCCCTQHSWSGLLQCKIRPNRQQTALTSCSPCWLVLAALSTQSVNRERISHDHERLNEHHHCRRTSSDLISRCQTRRAMTSVGQWGRPFAHLLQEATADARRHPRPVLAVIIGALLADARRHPRRILISFISPHFTPNVFCLIDQFLVQSMFQFCYFPVHVAQQGE
jgi:hypothetical protein